MGTRSKHRNGVRGSRQTATKSLLVLFVVMGAMLLAQVPLLAVHDDFMELDGDATSGAGLDWDNIIYNPDLIWSFAPDPEDGDVTYFKGGGSKDDLDVPSWRYDEASAPDKDEITNAYAAASFDETEGLSLYFGADRFSNDGDAAVGFWFFQEPIDLTQTRSKGAFEFSGQHTEGDVFIVSNFTNGGVVDTIIVYQWLGGELMLADIDGNPGTDCENTALTDDFVCGNVNDLDAESPWPYEPKPNVGVPGTFPPGAFFEGGVNLDAILDDGFGCFSSFLAETRSSQEVRAQLKDFALGQFEICSASIQIAETATNEVGDAHTFTVTVNKKVANTEMPADDFTAVTVDFASANGNTIPPQTCETLGGSCTVEINSAVGDVITAHASANVALLADDVIFVETDGEGDNTADAVKTYVDARISIEPDATNVVGDAHEFKVSVEENPGSGWVPAEDETVSVGFEDMYGADAQADTSCVTLTAADAAASARTDDAAGDCFVSINSNNAGQIVATATSDVSVGGLSLTRTTDGSETVPESAPGAADGSGVFNSGPATKTYVDAYITIEADATNEVGDPHTFTVTVYENDGSSPTYTRAAGEMVSVSGVGSVGTISGGTCMSPTDTNGQCTVLVDSALPGMFAVAASSNVSVGGESVAVTTDGSTRPSGEQNSNAATKTWVDATIAITPSATNEVGDVHEFKVSVSENAGDDVWVGAGDELVDVTFVESNGADGQAADSCTTLTQAEADASARTDDAAGDCFVTISSDHAGQVVASATADVSVGGLTLTRTTDGSETEPESAPGEGDGSGVFNSDVATKTWVDARISIEFDATNEVGDDHTFTVTVEKNLGDGEWVAAAGELVNVTLTDTNDADAVVSANSCLTGPFGGGGTDTNGQCEVTFSSATAGVTTGSASVSLDLGKTDGSAVDRTTDGLETVPGNGVTNSDAAVKTWVDATIAITPTATNEVGDVHEFKVSVSENAGDDVWVGAGDELVDVTFVESNGADAQAADSCTTLTQDEADASARTDDAAGDCFVTISSDNAGQIVATATSDVSVGPLTLTRTTDGLETVVGNGVFNSGPATKTYVDATIAITPTATNEVGDVHEFKVSVSENAGDDVWVGAGDELVDVTFVESNGADAQAVDSCTTLTQDEADASARTDDAAGDCFVTISSDNAGQIVATATSDVSVGPLTLTRTTDGLETVVGNGVFNSGPATKTYVDATIAITPTATNEVGDVHEFKVSVSENAGDDVWVGAGDELVDVTFVESNGADAQAVDSCTTLTQDEADASARTDDAAGDCFVTISSDNAGQIVATATSDVSVGPLTLTRTTDGLETVVGNGVFNSGPATKTYVDATIAITPTATNEVGDVHEFKVSVSENAGDDVWVGAGDELVDVTFVESNGADAQAVDSCTTLTQDEADASARTDDAAGDCFVTISSDNAGQIVATATSDVSVGPLTLTRTTDGLETVVGNGVFNSGPATKTYVDAYITITADGVNRISDEHEFLVTVWKDTGTTDGYVRAGGEDVTATEISGLAPAITGGTCTTGSTDSDGQCTVTVNSSASGFVTVSAEATITMGSVDVYVKTDGSARPNGTENSDPVTKTWVDAKIAIAPDATNRVNDAHTFTVSVSEDNGDGSGFVAVDEQLVSVSFEAADGAADPADTSCVTPTAAAAAADPADDVVAGECSVTINSSTTGTIVATASATVSTGPVGDEISILVVTDGSERNSGPATKTYVDAKIAIAPDATNRVNDAHTFTVSVSEDNGDGERFCGG